MLYSSLRFTFTSKIVSIEGKLKVHLSRSSKLLIYWNGSSNSRNNSIMSPHTRKANDKNLIILKSSYQQPVL